MADVTISSSERCNIVYSVIRSLQRSKSSRSSPNIANICEKKGLSLIEVGNCLDTLATENKIKQFTYAQKICYKISDEENPVEENPEQTPCINNNQDTPIIPRNTLNFQRYATSPRRETSRPVTRTEFENLCKKVNEITTQIHTTLEQHQASKIQSLEREIESKSKIINAKDELIDILEMQIKKLEKNEQQPDAKIISSHSPTRPNVNTNKTADHHKASRNIDTQFVSPPKKHVAKQTRFSDQQVQPIPTSNYYAALSNDTTEEQLHIVQVHNEPRTRESGRHVVEHDIDIDRNSEFSSTAVVNDIRNKQSGNEKSVHSRIAHSKQKQQNTHNKRRKDIIILGDSTTKNLDGFKMSSAKYKVTTHSLSGCNTAEMEILSQALCLRKPDILYIHSGTNDLYPKSGRDTENRENFPLTPVQIVENLKCISQKLQVNFPDMKVIISNLTTRDDHGDVGTSKVRTVNSLIAKSGLPYVSHNNIKSEHLNGSKLHLNFDGTILMSKNFRNYIDKYCTD